ncbi:fimbrillin family protein [Phocaeicola coprophilus]|uniref:fimbrillin family protein n=1 Tax=Phocaeicola coprophilus TaxID=387090 RepID=UPI00266D535A|nr:fimbrillin family protein [Phocaeicola coprophilus]
MRIRHFTLAALALALAACNNDNENLNGDPVAARFIADIAPATRVNSEGTEWTAGDRIGITDIGNDTQYGNVPFILKNGKFEAEEKVIYIEDAETHTFRAYYPYNSAGGTLAATTDATAQQNQPAIDFLFASGATGDKNNPVVSFTDKTAKGGEDNSFHHRMSQITLTFEAGAGVDFSQVKPERYTLDGLKLTGTFNTADGIATADDGAQTGELTMELADGSLTSSVILFPQTAASLPLVVNFNDVEYKATLTVPEGALQAGNNYTYTVKVRNKGIEVSEATIAKWNDIDGGEVGADL